MIPARAAGRPGGIRIRIVTLVLVALLAPLVPFSATADTEALPSGNWNNAVWIGDQAYLLGGYDGDRPDADKPLRDIVRVEPDGSWTMMDAKLPWGRWNLATETDGRYAYVFGGNGWHGMTDQILRYDPQADTLEVLPVALPHPTQGVGAERVGDAIYLFGGSGNGGAIRRFDPATLTITTQTATLPLTASWDPRAASNGTHIFLVTNDGRVHAYDLAQDTLRADVARLEGWVWGVPALAKGSRLYVLGGAPAWTGVAIVDMDTGERIFLESQLPRGFVRGGARWDGDAIVAITDGCSGRCNAIIRHEPVEPVAPPTVEVLDVWPVRIPTHEGEDRVVYYVTAQVGVSSVWKHDLVIRPAIDEGDVEVDLSTLGVQRVPGGEGHAEAPGRAWMIFKADGPPPATPVCVHVVAEGGRSSWAPVESDPYCLLPGRDTPLPTPLAPDAPLSG